MRSIVILAILLPLASGASSVNAQTNALASIQEIRESGESAIDRIADIEAIVTFVHPVHKFLFVQDGEHAIFVHSRTSTDVQKGDRVRVVGRIRNSGVTATIVPRRIETVRQGAPLPTPVDLSIHELEIGDEFDCRYVSLEGKVLQIVVADTSQVLHCQDGTKSFYVYVSEAGADAEDAHEWIGRRVKCIGALGVQLEKKPPLALPPNSSPNRVNAHRLFCGSASRVTLIDEGQRRHVASPRSLRSLLNTDPTNENFSTFGHISLVESSNDSSEIVLSDGRHALRVHLKSSIELATGMIVRVCGRRKVQNNEVVYEADVVQKLSSAEQSPTRNLVSEVAAQFETDPGLLLDQRLSVEGKPVAVREIDGFAFLEIETENLSVDVKLLAEAHNALAFASPDTARRIRVSGIVVPAERAESKVEFQIVVSDDDEIDLIEKRNLAQTLLVGIGALFGAMLLSLAWVRTLRTRVSEKTRDASNRAAQLTSSYDAIDDGVLAIDSSMRTLAVNAEFKRIAGTSPEVGRCIGNLSDKIARRLQSPDEFHRFWQNCLSDPSAEMVLEVEFDRPYVSRVIVRSAPIRTKTGDQPIGRLIILRDETENRRLQADLFHANKLEAVGRLVGGVAHDFNNILLAISANLTIAKLDEDLPVRSVAQELKVAEEATFRGAEILRRLLTFSTRTELELRPHHINEIIERLSELIRHSFDVTTSFEFQLDPSDPVVMAESTTLEQVLLNLYVNARDAMPDGGTITTSTEVAHNSATGRDFVVISVADEGIGIPESIRDKIFEPYFSTKTSDRGTGLGLSISYRAIQQHQGSIHVKPRPSGGTEFQVFLPVSNERVINEAPSYEALPRGSEKILVVDDEDVVRAVSQAMLSRQGYRTVPAASGDEALRYLEENAESVDAILLDVTMPGKSGIEILAIVNENWPQIPVILCSGYLGAEATGLNGPAAEIAKPYSMQQLVETVHSVLAAACHAD